MGKDAKKAWRPIEPMFIAAEHVPIRISRRRLRWKNAEDTAIESSCNSKPCRMPSVGRPINEGDKQKRKPCNILVAQQAKAEFTALIVKEQEIGGRTDENDRPPHSGQRRQKVTSLRNGLEQQGAPCDGAGPSAYAKQLLERT